MADRALLGRRHGVYGDVAKRNPCSQTSVHGISPVEHEGNENTKSNRVYSRVETGASATVENFSGIFDGYVEITRNV